MAVASTMARLCGGKNRKGGKCGRPKGWGTDHPGSGRCRHHGGASPSGKKYAARELVELNFPPGALGAEVEGEPIEAELQNVRLASGLVAYHRAKLARLNGNITRKDEEGYEQALLARSRITDMAVRGNVAERLVRIAERWSEQVSLVCEDGLAAIVAAGVALTAAQRTAYAEAVARSLARWEDQPVIEGHATDD